MDVFRRQLYWKFEMYSYLLWLEWLMHCLCQKKKYDGIRCFDELHLERLCTHSFPLKPWESKVSSSFWQWSWISLVPFFLRAIFPVIAQACAWVSVSSSVFMTFYIFFLTHVYPQISKKTCASHMCLCFGWWHVPMFSWRLSFFQKVLSTSYSDFKEHCLWQLAAICFI